MKKAALFYSSVFIVLTLLFTYPQSVSAAIIKYEYHGQNYVTTLDMQPPDGQFTTDMSLSGYFTAADPLINAFGDIQSEILSYYFFDGRTEYTEADSTISSFEIYMMSGTDFVHQWYINVSKNLPIPEYAGFISSTRYTPQTDYAYLQYASNVDDAVTASWGYWDDPAVIPIPGAVWLLGSGLIGVLGFRRKFRRRP